MTEAKSTNSDALQHNAVYRQQKIVEILKMLHEGGSFEDAKAIFDETFSSVDVSEITSAERALIATGLNPMEIQHLCNVHAAVFKGKISDNQVATPDEEAPGHPIQVLKLENLIITSLLKDELLPCLKKWQQDGRDQQYLTRIQHALADLQTIDQHYTRKENLIFPLMDKYGITAPPKVMWGVDDKIRGLIKTANQLVKQTPLPDKYDIEAAVEIANQEISEMIFKEEQIMLPMVTEVFTAADWGMVAAESDEIGYTLIAQPLPWRPSAAAIAKDEVKPKEVPAIAAELNEMAQSLADQQELTAKKAKPASKPISMPSHVVTKLASSQVKSADKQRTAIKNDDYVPTHLLLDANGRAQISFNNGTLDLSQLTGIFKVLPIDLTLVDVNDQVAWFSDNGDRIFPRTKAVVGRAVVNCHPPKSVDKVEKILSDFHNGTRQEADFWINFRGRMAYIRYFAVHDEDGEYIGCLEATQDITAIQALTGEKRLDADSSVD